MVGMAEWRNGGMGDGMAEWQKEWQNGRMAGMAIYVLFMVHADTDNDDDDDTLIFYSIETYFPPEPKTDTTAQLEKVPPAQAQRVYLFLRL
jgi:hypothetical protein